MACKKQSPSSNTILENKSSPQDQVTVFSVENGMLKFSDFGSFKLYKIDETKIKNPDLIAARSSGAFVSMQDAYEDIAKADALLGEQLAKQYPNGPAYIFDNTHTPLVKVFPNAFYVAGNAVNGFYYESNAFDKSVTGKINKDGFVQVGNVLLQYSKDSLKAWNTKVKVNNYFAIDAKNSIGLMELQKFIYSANSNEVASRNLFNWTEIGADARGKDCQNTVRVDNRNRRIIGRTNYNLYTNLNVPVGFSEYLMSITIYSKSLQGRVFGAWYDNWNTGNEIYYYSEGPSQGGVNAAILASNGANGILEPGFTTDWNNWIQNPIFNNVNEVNFEPVFSGLPIGQGVYPGHLVTRFQKPLFTKYTTRHTAYTGFPEKPYCSCEVIR
jgi:hypothetical protein